MTVPRPALVGLLAAGIAAHLLTRFRIRQAESRYPPSGEFITVDGVQLHYLCRGEGQGVVLLHGNTGCLEDFAQTVMDQLASRFRTCAFDRPGHGYSQRPNPASAEEQARLVHIAVNRLGLERPILVGHSWSGSLVLAYVLTYPDEVGGVVLLGAQTHPAPPPSPIKHWLLQAPVLGTFVRWTIWTLIAPRQIRNNLAVAYGPNPVLPGLAQRAAALWGRPGQVKAMAQDFLSVSHSLARMVDRYPEVRVPVIVVIGSDDPFVDKQLQAHRLVAKVDRAKLIKLAATGHEIAQSRPGEVVAAIEEAAKR